jgi:hypothetical protein
MSRSPIAPAPATTIRERRDEWIRAGAFARLGQIALEACDCIAGLLLDLAADGCITRAPGGGECAFACCLAVSGWRTSERPRS